jgi:putative ABC transport system permease protein
MSFARKYAQGLRALFAREKADAELDAELRGYLEASAAQKMRNGMSREQALRAARVELGSMEAVKDEVRGVGWETVAEALGRDIHFALRMLRKSPGFTLVAALTLALGIGATTAIFSVVNAVLLKPLPYQHSDGLMFVEERIPKISNSAMPVSAPDIGVIERDNHVFESLAAFCTEPANLSGAGEPQRIVTARVSADLFPMLGATPLLGRTFSPDEDPPGHFVAILSYALWQGHFGGDSAIIGKTVALDGEPYTVVGVMPASFEFPPRGMPDTDGASLWTPIALTPAELAGIADNFDYGIIGRHKPGVTLAEARSDMNLVAAEVLKTWEAAQPQIAGMGVKLEAPVTPLRQVVVSDVESPLYLLLAAVGFLLLIACANVANLLLSRAAGRQREITLRAALGAGRGRIARQLLTESVILALVGGASGLLLAIAGTHLLAASAPDSIPQLQRIAVDPTVLLFAILISVVTGVLFGLAPALAAAHVDLNGTLKEGGRSSGSSRRVLFARNVFVIAQVSIAFLLIIGGGLLVRSFVRAANSGAGVEPRNVLTAALTLPVARYPDPSHVHSFFQKLFARLQSNPGIGSVGAATGLPTETRWSRIFSVENHPQPASAKAPGCSHSLVLGSYFGAVGVHLVAGRFFTPVEEQGKSTVVIISAGLAKRYFPGEVPLGKRIKWGADQSNSPWLTIVGVVNDVKQNALDEPAVPHTYAPYLQDCADRTMMSFGPCSSLNIAIRAGIPSPEATADLRSAVEHFDSAEPVTHIRTLTEVLESSIAPRKFNMFLLSVFACTALFLAAIGLYSVLAYRVAQQTHEIGIRVVLGAQSKDVLRGVLTSGAKLVLFGLGIGAAAALALTRLMESLLYQVSATDPLTFLAVAVLLTLTGLLACYIPARRAMRVDPMVALRYE